MSRFRLSVTDDSKVQPGIDADSIEYPISDGLCEYEWHGGWDFPHLSS